MTPLGKRLKKLEWEAAGGDASEQLLVLLSSFPDDTPYVAVRNGDEVIHRNSEETEDQFLARAEREICGPSGIPPFTAWQLVRQSEMFETNMNISPVGPSIPYVTKITALEKKLEPIE